MTRRRQLLHSHLSLAQLAERGTVIGALEDYPEVPGSIPGGENAFLLLFWQRVSGL